MMQAIDQPIREQALNTHTSFIVQAPAGSGKTALLTQRYLALLAQVQNPEEILAISFTRKAAGEMRERVLHALQHAEERTSTSGDYLAHTRQLARAVLARDQQLGWQLIENPNRLRIQTIDALCASITRQMPVLSRLGAQPAIAENVTELYAAAAREILDSLEHDTTWSSALITLLQHLDNDYYKVEKLLSEMLARRDQWLPYIAGVDDPLRLREILERSLNDAVAETLLNLTNSLPPENADELIFLAKFAAVQLNKINSTSAILACLQLSHLPQATPADLESWLGLAELMLTQGGGWRKRLAQSEGFPPQSAGTTPAEKELFKTMKARMSALLERLSSDDTLLENLQDLRALPPTHYSDEQWQILLALLQLLPILVAQLHLIFQQRGVVDYIEIAQSALAALGDAEAPTDLALALDYRIQHMLVDEFQDTSIAQFRLLEQLTSGWQADDGRTLFLVGDPMQSIYRFRKAEVGLFLQACEQGIGNIYLTPLRLRVNFRSHTKIVDWINHTFKILMPQRENISAGAVMYAPSTAMPTENNATVITEVYPVFNHLEEAQTAVSIIQNTYANNPKAKIAVLVRARSHLPLLLAQLRQAAIPYRAIEIETLAERPHIQDIFALTRALLHLGDRIAWLAILRAPWCGILLDDLHSLVSNADSRATVWELLQRLEEKDLSADARIRLQRIISVLQHSLQQRQRLPLNQWIERTWLSLGGPACLLETSDLQDMQTYFKLLTQLQQKTDLPDMHELSQRLHKLYATAPANADNAVEVMTIHKAKGLEFDCVILPGLSRVLTSDAPQLLLALERTTAFSRADLLLAPIKGASEDYDPTYAYLYHEEQKRSNNEIIRLLYVAATRAKTALHLIAVVERDEQQPTIIKSPAKNSLLAHLWPALAPDFMARLCDKTIFSSVPLQRPAPTLSPAVFRRLAAEWRLPAAFSQEQNTHATRASAKAHVSKQAPIAIDKTLQIIFKLWHQRGIALWKEADKALREDLLNKCLAQQGLFNTAQSGHSEQLQQILNTLTEQDRLLWLFDAKHQLLHNNYRLIISSQGQALPISINKILIDTQGTTWLINYKLWAEVSETIITQEIKLQQQYLQNAAACLEKAFNAPVRLGLYFPLLDQWHEWAYP